MMDYSPSCLTRRKDMCVYVCVCVCMHVLDSNAEGPGEESCYVSWPAIVDVLLLGARWQHFLRSTISTTIQSRIHHVPQVFQWHLLGNYTKGCLPLYWIFTVIATEYDWQNAKEKIYFGSNVSGLNWFLRKWNESDIHVGMKIKNTIRRWFM
jgi:hypothetical protein